MIAVEDPLLEDSLSNGDKEQIVRRHRIISTALIGAACVAVVGAAASGSTVTDIAGRAVSAQDFGAGDASARSVNPDFQFSDLERYFPSDSLQIMGKEELTRAIGQMKAAFAGGAGTDPLAEAMGFFFNDMDMTITPSSCKQFLPSAYAPLASVTTIPEEAAMSSQYSDDSEYGFGERTVVVQVIRGGDLESMDVGELRSILNECSRVAIEVNTKIFGESATISSAIGVKEIPFDIGAEDQVAFALQQAITIDDGTTSWQYVNIAYARVGAYQFIATVDIPVSNEDYRAMDDYSAIHELDAVMGFMEKLPEPYGQ